MKNDCLFCAIIHDEMPAHKIYEDDTFIAILDRFPKCPGHILVMPKVHARGLFDMPEETLSKLLPLAKKLAEKLRAAVKPEGLNLLQNNGKAAGQAIDHFHLHLIPRYDKDDMVFQWKTVDPSPEEFADMVEKLKKPG